VIKLPTSSLNPEIKLALTTVILGLLVAISFALAKFIVQSGIPFFVTLYWQLIGATLILGLLSIIKKKRLSLAKRHINYYVIGGLLGISIPQLMAYSALQFIPAGLFTVLITLSPLMTFLIASLYERKLLPIYRFFGITIGLLGVSIATVGNFQVGETHWQWIVLALGVPLMLGVTNIYRYVALPNDIDALSIATGTLLSQVVLLTPVLLITEQHILPTNSESDAYLALVFLSVVIAFSYILTFIMQRMTDGVGFSQIGYFVTLGGVIIGAIFFGEKIGLSMILSICLLFLGLAISNGHLRTNNVTNKI